ncbi:MAG TPA: 50S ribosomal protein L24 [Dehalococcoidia bacterium]|jgi:large subunit ribosomal protein L24|nr:50S ribosomal protein L24 [Dehalococcoidia bacterium]
MNKIRRNDNVLVLTGKDRGKTGQVRSVLTKQNRIVVEGVNMIKKHQRPSQQAGVAVPGGIVTREGPIAVSNVMVVCKECNKASRTTVRIRQDGVKVRVCKRCGADID